MPLLRITNGFDYISDIKLLLRSREIYTQMFDNPNFPTPSPNLSDVHTAITAYGDALDKAASGNKYDIDDKNVKKAVVVDMLHNLGYYVLFTSKGNAVVAATSGFHIAKTGAPIVLQKPENQKVGDGPNNGSLISSVNAVKGAKSYLHQYTTDQTLAESTWVTMACTLSKCVLTGLSSGTRYYCRVAAIGSNEQIMYGDVKSRIVQ